MKAGALHPESVRQLATPRPCLPPTIKPALIRWGTTTMHFASSSTSSGMPLSGAAMISLRTSADFWRRSTESSLAEAHAMLPKHVSKLSKPASRNFFKVPSWKFYLRVARLIPRCPRAISRNSGFQSAGLRPLIRLISSTTTAITNRM